MSEPKTICPSPTRSHELGQHAVLHLCAPVQVAALEVFIRLGGGVDGDLRIEVRQPLGVRKAVVQTVDDEGIHRQPASRKTTLRFGNRSSTPPVMKETNPISTGMRNAVSHEG